MPNSSRRANRCLAASMLLLLLLAAFAQESQAQEQSQYDRGTPPQHAAGISSLGSYDSADIGTVNLSNGALNIKLPLGSVGGRGFSVPLSLNYSSKVWSVSRGDDIYNSGGNYQAGQPPAQTTNASVVYASYGAADISTDFYTRVAPGWTIGAQPSLKANTRQIGSNSNLYGLTTLTLVLPDKGEVQFRDDLTNGAPSRDPSGSGIYSDGNRGTHWHASDGSGMIYIADNDNGPVHGFVAGVVITSEGTRYRFVNISPPSQIYPYYGYSLGRCTSITDRNGNTMQISYPGSEIDYTDQLGRVTSVQQNIPDPENPGVALAVLVTIRGYKGQPRYYKVKLGAMHDHYRSDIHPQLPVITGDFDSDFYPHNYQYPSPHTSLYPNSWGKYTEYIDGQDVVTEMVLPDHRSIHFAYNEHGEVAEVQTPTGGKMQYDYAPAGVLPSGNTLSWEKSAGSPSFSNVIDIDRALVARRVYTNGTTPDSAWSYGYGRQTINGTNYPYTTVTANAGSTTGALLVDQRHLFLPGGRYTFNPMPQTEGTGYTLWSTGLEWRTETYDAAGVLLAASEQDWSQRVPVNWSPTTYAQEQPENDNRVNEERKILETGQTSKVHTLYDDYNNPTDVKEYDFDNTLKRHTVTSYVTTNSINRVDYTDAAVHVLRLPKETIVYDGSDTMAAKSVTEYDNYTAGDGNHAALQDYGANVTGHDAAYDANKQMRGLATAVGQWLDTTNTLLYSYPRYDTLGNVVAAKDARGNVSTISYADDYGDGSTPGAGTAAPTGGVPTYALPTQITSAAPTIGAAAHTAKSQYDYYSGLLTGFRDRNNVITQSIYNDSFDRPTLIKTALGIAGVEAHTQMYYAPTTVYGVTLANDDVLTAKDQTTLDDASLRGWTHTDGFGRVTETWTRDAQGDVKVEAQYDELGRQKRASNPYRPSQNESPVYTTTAYDMLGRAQSVTTADNALVTTVYSGNTVTVTDQAGKSRQSVTDALGRLTSVVEDAGDASHLNYQTAYQYDTLGNLRSVAQGQQTRSFVYDSLKRLSSATNPESGTISYQYDANGNILTKTDARGITATYAYDALNRAMSRSYSDSTPAVTYTYDTLVNGKGRLSSVSSSVSATSYSGYDALGRVTGSSQTTNGAPSAYAMSYGYDLAGHETSETYPSGRVITNSYDSAGREQSVSGQMSGASKTYASQMAYAAHGAIKAMQLGNNLWEHTAFNNRLQPEQIGLGTLSTNASVLQLDYTYHAANAADNNGNVQSQTIRAAGMTATQNYTYDSLNRLKTAQENNAGSWKQTFTYDRYGNRNFDTANTSQNVLGANPVISAANNRIVPQTNEYYRYDSAGNLDRDAGNIAFTYDAENKQSVYGGGATNGGANYYYDGDGKRVKKVVSSGTTVYVYDAGGQLVAEYTNSNQPGIGGTSYLTNDNLGTPRVITDQSGAVKARHDYLPFGEELYANIGGRDTVTDGHQSSSYGASDNLNQKFTGKQRDYETQLDYFEARYYSSTQGRFTSPDPIFVSDKQIQNPQLWNLYNYVNNNPLAYIDPTGMERVKLGQHSDEEIDKLRKEKDKQKKLIDKDMSFSKEERKEKKNALDAEKRTLGLEKQGNQVARAFLAKLDSIGERQGLQVEDFTLTTDTASDFAGVVKSDPGISPEGTVNAMFVLQGHSSEIFINAQSQVYIGARDSLGDIGADDFRTFAGTLAVHERSHRSSPLPEQRLSEPRAYTEQLRVLQRFGPNAFMNKGFYERQLNYVRKRASQ